MPNFTVEKVKARKYKVAVDLPKGDVQIKVRGLTRGVVPPTFEELDTIDVGSDPGFETEYDFETDNIYQLESETTPPDANDGIINVIVSEGVNSSMLESIKQILCSCGCAEWQKGKQEAALYHFNSLSLNYYTYLSIVNEQNADEFIFDQLTAEQLEEVATLQKIIDRVNKIKECVTDMTDLCKCK